MFRALECRAPRSGASSRRLRQLVCQNLHCNKNNTTMQLILSLLLFLIIQTEGNVFEEIYGNGEYAKKPSTFAHLSSSTEDLKKLLQIEKSIWKTYQNNSTFQPYFQEIDYDENYNTEDYLFHPINAFHLIQRCAKWYPKLFQQNSEYFHIFEHPKLILEQSAFGLVDLQVFHDFDIGKLVNGIILHMWNLWHYIFFVFSVRPRFSDDPVVQPTEFFNWAGARRNMTCFAHVSGSLGWS